MEIASVLIFGILKVSQQHLYKKNLSVIILMGGDYNTSEIVKHDGTTETSFDMKYDTQYETF